MIAMQTLFVRLLQQGKHVFVEKPLALDTSGLSTIQDAYTESEKFQTQPLVMVGFKQTLCSSDPENKIIVVTC